MFEIYQPTLLLDKVKCLRNIDDLVAKAKRSNVLLRPHFKTHQSHEIGRWFRERGVDRCTVSSVRMAEYFAEDGWKDITVAFPINYLEASRINHLALNVTLNLLVSATNVIPKLLSNLKNGVGIFIDIDTGYHRTGIEPQDHDTIEKVFAEIKSSPDIRFRGFLSHAGHTYKCKSTEEVKDIHTKEVALLKELKEKYNPGFPDLILSIGDTPSASMMDKFTDVDEVRAGNLVFYDYTQHKIGSCRMDQIAVAMACPVVATYSSRNEIIIYGGGVHFSKDLITDENGRSNFGPVVMLNGDGWQLPPISMYIKSLSQEHGIITSPDKIDPNIKPGTVLGILPVHSCLTADAMGSYFTLDGERIDMMN